MRGNFDRENRFTMTIRIISFVLCAVAAGEFARVSAAEPDAEASLETGCAAAGRYAMRSTNTAMELRKTTIFAMGRFKG